MSQSLKVSPRSSVDLPSFEIPDEDWHDAVFTGWTDSMVSKFPARDGEYPMVLSLKYELEDFEQSDGQPYEIRTKLFNPDNPHDKTLVANQAALAGREVDEDEEFDFGDYLGKRVRINVVHVDKQVSVDGQIVPRTYANIGKVSPSKKKAKAKVEVEDDFPEV